MVDKQIEKELEKLNKDIDQLHDKLSVLYEKQYELREKAIDLRGKYVIYKHFDDSEPIYLYVTETFKSGPEYIVRGYGFNFNYGEYSDDNWAEYNALFDITLKYNTVDELNKCLSRFKEITKEEYVGKLKEMADNLVQNGIEWLEHYKKEKENVE